VAVAKHFLTRMLNLFAVANDLVLKLNVSVKQADSHPGQ